MRVLSSSLLVLVALTATVLAPACSDDPVVPDREDRPLLPVPALEYIRPLVNTDLTFSLLIDVARNDVSLMVATAESTLTALVTAGVPLRDAWVTGGRDGFHAPTGNVFVGVRLVHADTSMSGHGFSAGATVPYYHYEDMRHYAFQPPRPDILPEEVLEVRRRYDDRPGLVYWRGWYPEAYSTYHGDYVLGQKWLNGPESYLKELIEAGVVLNNAWVPTTNHRCGQWGERGIVLEVAAPHPALGASRFVEGPPGDNLCANFMWNYCFVDCPGDVELPRPENLWTVLTPDRWRIFWRSVPSRDYEALFGSQEQVEQHLQTMLRAGVAIERAWMPVMAAAGEYTYMALETDRYPVWWWGYEDDPAGGVADANRWMYVRCYDLRDHPPDDGDPQPHKPHYFEQDFEGDP